MYHVTAWQLSLGFSACRLTVVLTRLAGWRLFWQGLSAVNVIQPHHIVQSAVTTAISYSSAVTSAAILQVLYFQPRTSRTEHGVVQFRNPRKLCRLQPVFPAWPFRSSIVPVRFPSFMLLQCSGFTVTCLFRLVISSMNTVINSIQCVTVESLKLG